MADLPVKLLRSSDAVVQGWIVRTQRQIVERVIMGCEPLGLIDQIILSLKRLIFDQWCDAGRVIPNDRVLDLGGIAL